MKACPPWIRPSAFCGKRRAFRNAIARAEAQAAFLRADPSAWWDMWHFHADWHGWGNLSWSYRRRFLEALVIIFRKVASVGPQLSTPFQSWMMLADDDAGGDATFLHTPNPNGTPFPAVLGPISWGRKLPEARFEKLLPEYALRIGLCEWKDTSEESSITLRRSWLIYSPGVGVPLESAGAVEQGAEADEARARLGGSCETGFLN